MNDATIVTLIEKGLLASNEIFALRCALGLFITATIAAAILARRYRNRAIKAERKTYGRTEV